MKVGYIGGRGDRRFGRAACGALAIGGLVIGLAGVLILRGTPLVCGARISAIVIAGLFVANLYRIAPSTKRVERRVYAVAFVATVAMTLLTFLAPVPLGVRLYRCGEGAMIFAIAIARRDTGDFVRLFVPARAAIVVKAIVALVALVNIFGATTTDGAAMINAAAETTPFARDIKRTYEGDVMSGAATLWAHRQVNPWSSCAGWNALNPPFGGYETTMIRSMDDAMAIACARARGDGARATRFVDAVIAHGAAYSMVHDQIDGRFRMGDLVARFHDPSDSERLFDGRP